ncbi:transglycosylase domain-containing protein [Sphingobacterium sp. E70]|uniref:transglycosylase domain-containing protein n=1 Tax=Sphingobacterium sp. E70 TaxID=2853439 RepID=UPI00359C6D1B
MYRTGRMLNTVNYRRIWLKRSYLQSKRFYDHSGIDYSRTFTVIFHTLTGNKQGGSTITQQLALNLFLMAVRKTF